MLLFLLIVLLGYAAYNIFLLYRHASTLPPGPMPFPFIGNLLVHLKLPKMYEGLESLREKYGGVFTIHMPFPVVNVADFDVLREIMKSDDFSNRPHTVITDMITQIPNGGIVSSNGENWREQRRVAIHILRDFGMGRNLMEEKLFVANVINDMVFGYRYTDETAGNLVGYLEATQKSIEDGSRSVLFLAFIKFPWLRHVPIVKEYAYDRHERNWRKVSDYVVSEVRKSIAAMKEDDEPGCFVQAYMQKAKSNTMLNEDQLISSCNDLFLAGQETTTTTLRWAMLFMAAHQDVQERIRTEIRLVVGSSNRLPALADKPRMPYTCATLLELQRRANILPLNFGILRETTADTTIAGMKIAAGTALNNDLHQIMAKDPLFVDPERFWPDRYLEEDGITFKKDLVDRTIPFGIGRRQCAGEGIARVELFVGLTATVQHFKILPPLDGVVDLEPVCLATVVPKDHLLQLEPIAE